MPNWASLTEYGRALKGFEVDLTEKETEKITRQMGKEAERLAAINATRSLGADRAFSGWNRGAPIPLDTRIRPGRDGATLFTPTKRSAKVWTVVQSGRHAGGGVGGFQGPSINRRSGSTTRTKSGAVSTRRQSRRVRRWNGVTHGMGTAARTIADMNVKLPRIASAAVLKVTRKHFDVT